MSHTKSLRRLTVAFLILVLAAPLVLAQNRPTGQNPMDNPRNVKPELKKAYKDWLEKDVAYIITDEEKKAFKKLQTDEEREQFIEIFWRRRDPDPDTDENEYREEYYERIAYANEHFASGIPGWKTDRGRIYIMYGKADEIESHPTGGSYDRPSYHGGGNTTTYPFEVWFYRHLPGVGSGIEIEFVDPSGSGEYRIARSPEEKDALLNIPGAGLTLSEQLGLSSKVSRINGYAAGTVNPYGREQDSPFSRLQLYADLQRPPQVQFKDLEGALTTTGSIVEDNPLNFDVRVDFFKQSDERVITAFTIQADNSALTFADSGGVQTARMNIFGRITAVSGRRAGIFEDPVITTATLAELTQAKSRKSVYQKPVALAPGTYKVDVIVRDVTSGATGVRKLGFTVPKYDSQKLSTSTLMLAARLEGLGDQPAVGQFVIGQVKVIPNIAATYHRGDPLGLYMQVYNSGIDQTTLRPSVNVEYVFTQNGKEISKIPETWQGLSDAGQRLTLAKLFSTDKLTPGKYRVEVRINDRVSGQTLSPMPSAEFTIIE
ncbi:MAG TPA: GWxTD domain-containing protein [Pyrinomonadaceae bacterium]|jgi:GWxTD domain-containing protein|nr:GWxTD domain-containing protein [Pyrinomonadaceae bacterium]